jgi:hypothetical protein
VWARELIEEVPDEVPTLAVKHFSPGELEEFLYLLAVVEQQSDAQKANARINVQFGERDERWHYYRAYVDGAPCSTATLFAGKRIAYLEWSRTHKE